MKKIIYITGPQGSGKSTLADSFKNSVVYEFGCTYPEKEWMIAVLDKHDTLVLVSQKISYSLIKDLKELKEKNSNIFFLEINCGRPSKVSTNILEQANQIVNHRAEEKERQYGPFEESMEHMRDIFNSMTGLNLTTEHMYKAMIAGKFARERFSHKQDNLLDACSYIGSLNNYIENQAVKK